MLLCDANSLLKLLYFQLYIFFILFQVLGPKLMENRKPYELKNVLIWYNLFQVIFSCWLFNEVIKNIYLFYSNLVYS